MFFAGFDLLFSILFPILFLVVLGMILYAIIGNIRTWNKNNHSPRLTVPAAVVAKRTEVSHHHTDNTMMHTFTTYYVTFQVESGDRMELTVKKKKNICCPFAGRDSLRRGTADVFLFCDAVRFTPQWAWSGRTSPQWPCGSGRRTASPGRQRRGLPAPDPCLRGNCG